MTTEIVNPVITVKKVYKSDQAPEDYDPVYEFFENLQDSFTMPDVGEEVTIQCADSSKYAIGQAIWINGIGFLTIVGIVDDEHLLLANYGADGNAAAGSTVALGTIFMVCPPPVDNGDSDVAIVDTLAQQFVVPVDDAKGTLYVNTGGWYAAGMMVFVQGAGFFRIDAFDTSTNALDVYNASVYNATGGTVVAAGGAVWPQQAPERMPDNSIREQAGVTAEQTLSANNYASPCSVVFDEEFTVAPTVVMISMYSAGDAGSVGNTYAYVTNISETGFDIVWDSDLTSKVFFHWVARR